MKFFLIIFLQDRFSHATTLRRLDQTKLPLVGCHLRIVAPCRTAENYVASIAKFKKSKDFSLSKIGDRFFANVSVLTEHETGTSSQNIQDKPKCFFNIV